MRCASRFCLVLFVGICISSFYSVSIWQKGIFFLFTFASLHWHSALNRGAQYTSVEWMSASISITSGMLLSPFISKKLIGKLNFTFRSYHSRWKSHLGQGRALLSMTVEFWHRKCPSEPLWTVLKWNEQCKSAGLGCAGSAARGKITQPITDWLQVLAEVVFFSFFPQHQHRMKVVLPLV